MIIDVLKEHEVSIFSIKVSHGSQGGGEGDRTSARLCTLKIGDHFMTGYLEGVTMTEDDSLFFLYI
jgi:hypothetical protein